MKNIGILCASDTELEPFLNYIERANNRKGNAEVLQRQDR